MTRIAHASDLHGDLGPLFDLVERDGQPDVWVLTGDIFPNDSRGIVEIEAPFQAQFAADFAQELAELFGSRPVVTVPGNHDYVDLAAILREFGCDAHAISETASVQVAGHSFGGFRHIPWIAGEWAGETHAFGEIIDQVFSQDIDILVTHAPAAGILDQGHSHGITELMTALAYRPHGITAHFFGHIHECGGRDIEEMGIRFINGAETCRMIEV